MCVCACMYLHAFMHMSLRVCNFRPAYVLAYMYAYTHVFEYSSHVRSLDSESEFFSRQTIKKLREIHNRI